MDKLEFDQIITVDGKTVTLDDYREFFTWGFRGRGMPPMAHRTERGPFQHGDTLLNYVLRPRIISFMLRRNKCSRQEYWDARNELMDILRPNRHYDTFDTVILRKIMPNRSMRDIRVMADAGPDFMESDEDRWEEFSYSEVLRFVAYDPTFFDPNEIIVSYALSSSYNEMSFPITFPVRFTISENIEAFAVTNDGTWETYPDILFNGPITEPVIKNITTGEIIKMNYTIPAGGSVTISLSYGNKYVLDDFGNSLIGLISSDSDLASFHLAVDPIATNGVNSIGVSAYNLGTGSEVVMRYFKRYIGI